MLDLNPGSLEVIVKIQTILQGLRLLRRGQWRRYCGGAMHRKDNSEEIALL